MKRPISTSLDHLAVVQMGGKRAGCLSCHSLPPALVSPFLGIQRRNGQVTLISSWVFRDSITKEIVWQARQYRFGPWFFYIGSETQNWKFSPSQFSLSWGLDFTAALARLLYQLLSASLWMTVWKVYIANIRLASTSLRFISSYLD